MTDAENHQQQLERHEYLSGVVHHEHSWRCNFETHVHSSDKTVFLNISAGVIQTTFYLDIENAKVLLEQLSLAITESKND